MTKTKLERYKRQNVGSIRIDIAPTGRSGQRGPTFNATCTANGQCFALTSVQPLLDMARVLLAAGIAPGTRIGIWHAHSTEPALSSTIARAGGLAIAEGQRDRPHFVKWTPHYLSSE